MTIYKVTIKTWLSKTKYFKTKKGAENWIKTWKMILGKNSWSDDHSYEIQEIEVEDKYEIDPNQEYRYGVEVFFNIVGPKTGIHNRSPYYDEVGKEDIIHIELPNPREGKQGKILVKLSAKNPEDAVNKSLELAREIIKDRRAINEAYLYLSMVSDSSKITISGKYEDIIENKNYVIKSSLEILK